MAARKLFGRLGEKVPRSFGGSLTGVFDLDDSEPPADAPLGGTRAEAIQRLQVGLTGLLGMVAMIGIAGIVGGQADIAEEAAVPDAAPTTEPSAAPPQRDPLADAGVVPDIPAEPGAQATGAPDRNRPGTVPDTQPGAPQEPKDEP